MQNTEGIHLTELQEIWIDVASRYSSEKDLIQEYWNEIETSYSGKKRHYHNLSHLSFMFKLAIEFKNNLKNYDEVLFSIFYHDIIYSVSRKNNEEASAETASRRLGSLGLSEESITHCQSQIIATKKHEHSGDSDTNFLLDFDLAILGESRDRYKSYCNQVRKEYSIYPSFIYCKGRKKVLNHFLSLDHIFKTKEFRERYEEQARRNLKNELEQL